MIAAGETKMPRISCKDSGFARNSSDLYLGFLGFGSRKNYGESPRLFLAMNFSLWRAARGALVRALQPGSQSKKTDQRVRKKTLLC
jgi:hypothetical protein